METKRHTLEIVSWIAGIFSAFIAAYAYFRPPSPVEPSAASSLMGQPMVQQLVPTPIPTQTSVKPSFDCSKATWKSERLVCSSPQVALQDLSLANEYREAIARNPQGAQRLKSEQNQWLRKIRESCDDVSCLQRIYEARVQELRRH